MRLCSGCGHLNSLAEMFFCAECGASLRHAETVDAEEAVSSEAFAQPPHVPAPPHPAPPATTREVSARLVFDWGEVPVTGRLAIGSDAAFSPIADRLRPFSTVSRRHAEVIAENGVVFVRHIGQTNPTYVDGRPLNTGDTAALDDGTMIGFSRAVSARFQRT